MWIKEFLQISDGVTADDGKDDDDDDDDNLVEMPNLGFEELVLNSLFTCVVTGCFKERMKVLHNESIHTYYYYYYYYVV